MKRLHRKDLYGWSVFDEDRDIDFHSVLWAREEGNVVIDPLPLSDHDRAHLHALGGAAYIVVTNSDHVRDAASLARETGARIVGPGAEADGFPLECDRWVTDGDEVVPGLATLEMQGSKTPGELALLLEESTLVTGDLIRAHEGGALCLLPDTKLTDKRKAIESVRRVAALPRLHALLPGDGWPVFRNASDVLGELLATL